jgi:hypothetical protein
MKAYTLYPFLKIEKYPFFKRNIREKLEKYIRERTEINRKTSFIETNWSFEPKSPKKTIKDDL